MKKIFMIFTLTFLFFWGENPSIIQVNKNYRLRVQNEIKTISKPVVYLNGILFTYAGKKNDKIYLSGSFSGWRENHVMKKSDFGIFYFFLKKELGKGVYTYRYNVNTIWVNDPLQKKYENDGYGSKISAFVLDKEIQFYDISPKKLKEKGYYLFFLKDNNYKQVSWVGSKNAWDPYVDQMELKKGYWVLKQKINFNYFFYKYYVDGKVILDPANPNVTRLKHGDKVNFVPLEKKVKKK